MINFVLFVHLLICIALVVLVLMQRSEGGALGIGGGGSGLISGRGAANVLSRATAWLGGAFFVTSLTLTFLGMAGTGGAGSVTEQLDVGAIAGEAPAPAAPAPAAPQIPTDTPLVPGTAAPVQGTPQIPTGAAPAPAAPATGATPAPESGQR